MTWDFFLFQRIDIKLQINTKLNGLGLVEVLKKLSNTLKKGEPWNNSTIFEGPVHDMWPFTKSEINRNQPFFISWNFHMVFGEQIATSYQIQGAEEKLLNVLNIQG